MSNAKHRTYSAAEQGLVLLQEKQGDRDGARRLAKDSHLVRITAKGANIRLDPFERKHLITQAEVGCSLLGKLATVPAVSGNWTTLTQSPRYLGGKRP